MEMPQTLINSLFVELQTIRDSFERLTLAFAQQIEATQNRYNKDTESALFDAKQIALGKKESAFSGTVNELFASL